MEGTSSSKSRARRASRPLFSGFPTPNHCSLFAVYSPKSTCPPHPPHLWKSFFGPSFACNYNDFNDLIFLTVN